MSRLGIARRGDELTPFPVPVPTGRGPTGPCTVDSFRPSRPEPLAHPGKLVLAARLAPTLDIKILRGTREPYVRLA